MKIIIESTTRMIQVVPPGGGAAVPARIWQGMTETGIPLVCAITRVSVGSIHDQAQFEAELEKHEPPNFDAERAIPMRLLL